MFDRPAKRGTSNESNNPSTTAFLIPGIYGRSISLVTKIPIFVSQMYRSISGHLFRKGSHPSTAPSACGKGTTRNPPSLPRSEFPRRPSNAPHRLPTSLCSLVVWSPFAVQRETEGMSGPDRDSFAKEELAASGLWRRGMPMVGLSLMARGSSREEPERSPGMKDLGDMARARLQRRDRSETSSYTRCLNRNS
nr:hypothetical protein CFP56_09625 [Quercus suber]